MPAMAVSGSRPNSPDEIFQFPPVAACQAPEAGGVQIRVKEARSAQRCLGPGRRQHDGVHAPDASHRFPQRARGQAAPVAEPAFVDDHQFESSGETDVLQAVVADQDITLGMPTFEQGRGSKTIPPDSEGQAGLLCKQQRFVADFGCPARVLDQLRSPGSGAVTARQEPRSKSVLPQTEGDGSGEWRLPRTARHQVSNHDHRRRRCIGRLARDPPLPVPRDGGNQP